MAKPRSDLAKLRRTRSQIHFQLAKLEPLVAGYQTKLADVEAAILDLDPQLWLPPRRRRPNPHFARNELPTLALGVLRDANGPVRLKDIAIAALAAKGVTHPGRGTMKATRVRLQQFMSKWEKRGLVRKVGVGRETRRELVGTMADVT